MSTELTMDFFVSVGEALPIPPPYTSSSIFVLGVIVFVVFRTWWEEVDTPACAQKGVGERSPSRVRMEGGAAGNALCPPQGEDGWQGKHSGHHVHKPIEVMMMMIYVQYL